MAIKKRKDIKPIEDKEVESNIVQMTPEQIFSIKYKQLCKETGCEIMVAPIWRARDDGTYSMIIKTTVSKTQSK